MMLFLLMVLLSFRIVEPNGLLLLYQPKDITNECAFSRRLRFDISFGMGMADTITLVFRSLNDLDYECLVEIVGPSSQYLLVVVRYPTTVTSNCALNTDAFTVLKRWRCFRLCDLLDREVYSPYFVFAVKERLRLLFKSNSSINSDIDIYNIMHFLGVAFIIMLVAKFYQVTITAARIAPKARCYRRNETICTVDRVDYCFTNGVVCDGIKNCGVEDWFDERKSSCSMPEEKLGYAPVITVMAALLCLFIAGGHALFRCLPPHARSFFIFNENEDNRLCIDPVLVPRGVAPDIGPFKRTSIIPISSSLSSETESIVEGREVLELQNLKEVNEVKNVVEMDIEEDTSVDIPEKPGPSRRSIIKSMTKKIQENLFMTRYKTGKSDRKMKRINQV